MTSLKPNIPDAKDIPEVTAFEQLGTVVVWVVLMQPLRDPGGKTWVRRMKMHTPTYHEYHRIRSEVEDPPIPRTLWDASGSTKLPNPLDKSYLAAKGAAEEERDFRLLIFCFEKAGIMVPGDTIEAKIETMKTTLDAGIANALIKFLKKSVEGGSASLITLADNF